MISGNDFLKELYWGGRNLDRYKHYKSLEWLPFIGGYFGREANRLAERENEKYWDDFYENTAPNNSRYPIKQYQKENHYIDGGIFQDMFEATQSIINLYKRW